MRQGQGRETARLDTHRPRPRRMFLFSSPIVQLKANHTMIKPISLCLGRKNTRPLAPVARGQCDENLTVSQMRVSKPWIATAEW